MTPEYKALETEAIMSAQIKLQHWRNGGTGLTNFQPEQLPDYEAALAAYSGDDIRIEKAPLDCGKNTPLGDYSLHCTSGHDASEFWRVFREVNES